MSVDILKPSRTTLLGETVLFTQHHDQGHLPVRYPAIITAKPADFGESNNYRLYLTVFTTDGPEVVESEYGHSEGQWMYRGDFGIQ